MLGRLGDGERSPLLLIGERAAGPVELVPAPARSARPPAVGRRALRAAGTGAVDEALDRADLVSSCLPRFASAAHKEPRAPQNLIPIAGLEHRLRHLLGDPVLLERSLRLAAAGSGVDRHGVAGGRRPGLALPGGEPRRELAARRRRHHSSSSATVGQPRRSPAPTTSRPPGARWRAHAGDHRRPVRGLDERQDVAGDHDDVEASGRGRAWRGRRAPTSARGAGGGPARASRGRRRRRRPRCRGGPARWPPGRCRSRRRARTPAPATRRGRPRRGRLAAAAMRYRASYSSRSICSRQRRHAADVMAHDRRAELLRHAHPPGVEHQLAHLLDVDGGQPRDDPLVAHVGRRRQLELLAARRRRARRARPSGSRSPSASRRGRTRRTRCARRGT